MKKNNYKTILQQRLLNRRKERTRRKTMKEC